MGTLTTNLGLYKPAFDEVSYDDEFAASMDKIDTRIRDLSVNVKDKGALGNGSADDSSAVQAAINTGAPWIFYPPGDYRLGTPLTAHSYQHHQGSGFWHESGSVLRPTGSNHAIFSIDAATIEANSFADLSFSDRNLGNTYDTDGGDVAFQGGANTNAIQNTTWNRCMFLGLKYAFDLKGSDTWGQSAFLINRMYHTRFRTSPSRFNTDNYINDNHFFGCEWNAIRKNLPAITWGSLRSAVVDGGNSAQGIWYIGCYFESVDRQAIVFRRTFGGVRDTYFESIGEDATTYTAKDGRSHALPVIDLQQRADIELSHNWFIGFNTDAIWWGNTDTTSTDQRAYALRTDWVGSGTDATYWYDASNIEQVFSLKPGYEATTRGGNTPVTVDGSYTLMRNNSPSGPWTTGGGNHTLTVDALWGDWFEVCCNGGGYPGDNENVVIANPTSATRGRMITFEFVTAENNYNFQTITFGSKFSLAGSFTPPAVAGVANGFARFITFIYDGKNWLETSRSASDITVPYA